MSCLYKSYIAGVALREGDDLDAVVVYIDPVAECLELSFKTDLVNAVKNLSDNKFSQVSTNTQNILLC